VVCGVDGVRTERRTCARGRDVRLHDRGCLQPSGAWSCPSSASLGERRLRERGGKIVVVASRSSSTGGGPHLARLVHRGYVQALLGGNGLAAHDIEQALFGTSLGVDLKRGITSWRAPQSSGGDHLVRAQGGIRQAVEAGVVRSGVMYESVRHGVPFALAGSIRDDGPLPDTLVDLIAAQAEYARLIEGADMSSCSPPCSTRRGRELTPGACGSLRRHQPAW